MKPDKFDLKVRTRSIWLKISLLFKTVAEALGEIEAAANAPPKKVERSAAKETTCVDRALTKHSTKCPDCDGRVEFEERSVDKSKMTVYGRSGVRQVLHATYRCVEKHCRTGLYHGYRIMKGGSKVFESYCLDPSQVFLVVSRKTAFDIDFLYEMTLKIYRHNATLEGLSEEFNDFFCDGNKICFFLCKIIKSMFTRLRFREWRALESRSTKTSRWLVHILVPWAESEVFARIFSICNWEIFRKHSDQIEFIKT